MVDTIEGQLEIVPDARLQELINTYGSYTPLDLAKNRRRAILREEFSYHEKVTESIDDEATHLTGRSIIDLLYADISKATDMKEVKEVVDRYDRYFRNRDIIKVLFEAGALSISELPA